MHFAKFVLNTVVETAMRGLWGTFGSSHVVMRLVILKWKPCSPQVAPSQSVWGASKSKERLLCSCDKLKWKIPGKDKLFNWNDWLFFFAQTQRPENQGQTHPLCTGSLLLPAYFEVYHKYCPIAFQIIPDQKLNDSLVLHLSICACVRVYPINNYILLGAVQLWVWHWLFVTIQKPAEEVTLVTDIFDR